MQQYLIIKDKRTLCFADEISKFDLGSLKQGDIEFIIDVWAGTSFDAQQNKWVEIK